MSLLYSCDSNTTDEEISQEVVSSKKVQALLLTQAFPYDSENKNKQSTTYIANEQLEVPLDLAPQNKWVMFEGPVLENDLIAYRFYMDSRHRSDIYGKRVNDLVMDTVGWQYHDIMDWGSDILKVNQSLGIGSPAIYYQDSIYTLSEYDKKTVQIIKQTDDEATIRTRFVGLKIQEEKMNLIQDWSIRAGEAWTTINLKMEKGALPAGMQFATGIVKHLEEIQSGTFNQAYYAFTWGKQSFHKENMGMGLVMSEQFQPEYTPNIWSHVYVFKNANEQVSYRFLAAWERDVIGVKNGDDFQSLMQQACRLLQ